MRGQKLIHLPVSFRYSEGGQYKEDTAVTLLAPSLDQFKVHNTMSAYAAEAAKNIDKEQALTLAAMGPALDTLMKARAEMQADAGEQPEPPAETDEQMAQRVMSFYASGLGQKFPDFMDYLKTTLTNNPKLVRVGETLIPLKDESWVDIDNKGGMEAVQIVLAAFANFFLRDREARSAEKSGNSSQPTSRLPAAVH